MDILKTPLIAIFKEQDPYRILGNYFKFNNFKTNNSTILDKKVIMDLCQQINTEYSKDEVENLYYIVEDSLGKRVQGHDFNKSVFNLLINYSEKMIENYGNNIKCRYKELLKWRMVTLKLDQDLFITSFLAFKDLLMHVEREYFDWDTVIKSNNIRLHNMLSKGMCENHFHLKGSAPNFKLSWVSLMNDISNRKLSKLDGDSIRLEKDLDGIFNIEDSIVISALIRAILFIEINRDTFRNEDHKTGENEKTDSQKAMIKILKSIINGKDEVNNAEVNKEFISVYSSDIQTEINTLKFVLGADLKYKNNNVKVDYAITKDIKTQDMATRLFIGERAFMYKCFQKIYKGDKEFNKKADLFYAYIIIKNKVRGELIQQNNRVGFANFADYQGRKTGYLKDNTILKDAVEPLAILTSIKNQNILSIEARVIPAENKLINVTGIEKTDNLILNQIYNDSDNFWVNEHWDLHEPQKEYSISERDFFTDEKENKYEKKLLDNYFYVFHFPKIKDPLEGKTEEEFYQLNRCRHYNYRKKLKNWGTAIYKMREENQKIASRVLGIDACSNELYIRPEVYGQVYRFLKGHLAINDYQRLFNKGKSIPKLKATYHVGEDFLDVIDGLRAIDEAKIFLNLTHGDRLGHAIALGIDVEEWYRKKNNRIFLSKQALLDNVAWLIIKIKSFNIQNGSDIIDKLIGIYNKYYIDIYTIETDKAVIPVDIYMEAWKLRGDNPEYYNDKNMKLGISYWDRCAKRSSDNIISDNNVIEDLYKRYHYDPKVKVNGYKKAVFKIEPYMTYAIKEVQRCMQVSIRECGIGIECNPSSNVLISNFDRYDKHPILSMYNLGLTIDEDNAAQYPQMFVSINTDDQGVFDTLLENEYALMGIALEKAKNKDGNPLYNQSMIYDWLDRVRQMGLEQSFRLSKNSKNRF